MKTPALITGLAVLAALAGGFALFQQRSQLATLETKAARLEAAKAAVLARTAPVAAKPVADDGLTDADRLELLRLRAEVTRLKTRQVELAAVRIENQALRAQVRQKTPPPGYVRMRDAKFAGQSTPETAFQSFIWAIGQGDTNALCQVLSPHQADRLMQNLERTGKDEMLMAARIIPGFRIVELNRRSDTEVGLKVELLPGQEAQEMTVVLEGGRWRVEP